MVVGVCRVTLLVPESHSLKEKRMVIRRIKDRVRQKHHVALAEVGEQDSWQTVQLGFAVVSNEHGFTQAMVQRVLDFIDALAVAKLVDDEQDYITYGDVLDEQRSGGHWEPE